MVAYLGFPSISGTILNFGGPQRKDYTIWVSILGSPYFVKLPFTNLKHNSVFGVCFGDPYVCKHSLLLSPGHVGQCEWV